MENAIQKSINIRLVTKQDGQLLFDLMTGQKWLAYIGDRGIETIMDAKQYILDKMHPDLKEKGFVNHVIIDEETRGVVGTCSLHNRNGLQGLDIGYAILEQHEGKGYATLAAKKMVDLAFCSHGAERVYAITTEANSGSCRVLEKVGFEHEGYVQLPTGNESLKLYVLFKNA